MSLFFRFYDLSGTRAVPIGSKRGIQHLLDTMHVVHKPAEGGPSLSQVAGFSRTKDNNGGLFSRLSFHV